MANSRRKNHFYSADYENDSSPLKSNSSSSLSLSSEVPRQAKLEEGASNPPALDVAPSFSAWATRSRPKSNPAVAKEVPAVGNSGAASDRPPRVVVVGGGVAGSLLSFLIQHHADVTLIDPKEYFEIPWANMKSKVDPAVADKSLINHTDYLTNGKIVTSAAASVNEKEVITVEGDRVEYDYLVIATGHIVPAPKSRRERIDQFLAENVKIKHAASVLVIGGGPTGVEFAGEIKFDYPNKTVILVHRGPRLLEFIGRKASKQALDWLKSRDVHVLLDQKVDITSISETDTAFKTSAGEEITADCHFVCVGRPLGNSWLHGSFLEQFVNNEGRLMVDESLRVGGRSNIFAIGDITDIQEWKQGYLAQRHAVVVAKNLKLLFKNGAAKEQKLVKYRPETIVPMVPLGKKDAVAQLSFTSVIGFIPGLIRSKYLFVHRTRKKMGLDH